MNDPIQQEWPERPPQVALDDVTTTVKRLEHYEATSAKVPDARDYTNIIHQAHTRDDGARLQFDPEQTRRDARTAAKEHAHNSVRELRRSLAALAIDRPGLADEYQGGPPSDKHRRGIDLLSAMEDYLATVVDLEEKS
jgi:hypothetical protein